MFFSCIYYTLKNMFFNVFYLLINVFIIYDLNKYVGVRNILL